MRFFIGLVLGYILGVVGITNLVKLVDNGGKYLEQQTKELGK